jgi:hypothetical protein
MSRQRTLSSRILSRDALSTLGGWAMMIYQIRFVDAADFNLWVFLTGAALANVPGVGTALASRASALTGGSPQAPASSPPGSPPAPSSATSSEADR